MSEIRISGCIILCILLLIGCPVPGPGPANSPAPNQPPVASIYCANETGVVGEPIVLDGSQSHDPDIAAGISFAWDFTTKPAGSSLISLNNNTEVIAGFTPDMEGVYTVHLTVTDGYGKTDTDTITLAISALEVSTTLASITLSIGLLSPEFNPEILAYGVNVANTVTSITVNATTTDGGAQLDGTGVYILSVGVNTITLTVTAPDGLAETVYTIAVNRASPSASSDATLLSLSISAGTLSPAFGASIYSYTATVPYEVSSIVISAVANDPNAAVAGRGNYELFTGVNHFTVTVIAEDGIAMHDYELSVTREAVSYEDILFVSGFRQNSDQNRVACSWSSGAVTDLENNTFESIAASCWKENDVFCMGGHTRTNDAAVACYWLNGVRVDLENNTIDSFVTDIVVASGVVYCSGYTKANGGAEVSCYWTNGVRTDLANNTFISITTGISVSGSTIVVSGFTQQDVNANRVACYWLNGVRTDVGNNTYISEALDVAAADSDIYIAGFTQNSRNYTVACYWLNGVRTDLANNTYESKALGIDVDNAIPYICGYTRNHNNYPVACVWVNTVRSDLGNNTYESMPYSIIRENNITFISGYTKAHNAEEVACYWENGMRSDLANNTYNSRAMGLFYY